MNENCMQKKKNRKYKLRFVGKENKTEEEKKIRCRHKLCLITWLI